MKTIKNVTETSKIVLKATELLDKELNSISCSGYTTNVNVTFDEIKIVRHGAKPNYYGVTLRQGWNTKNYSKIDKYSDEGIVFIVWDFTDEFNPKIMVRTWQPMNVDDKDVFTLGNFKLN